MRVGHGEGALTSDPTGPTVLENRHSDVDDGLRASMPPARFRPVQLWSLDSVNQVSLLRRELLEATAPTGRPSATYLQDVPERMVLVASELATNALTHGAPPTVVTLMDDGECFLLDVADHDTSTSPQVAGDRPIGNGGFGLVIARRLAQDVGWYASDTTKHVWATFPMTTDGPHHHR